MVDMASVYIARRVTALEYLEILIARFKANRTEGNPSWADLARLALAERNVTKFGQLNAMDMELCLNDFERRLDRALEEMSDKPVTPDDVK